MAKTVGSNGDLNLDVMVKQACQLANDTYPDLDFSAYDLNKDGIIDNVFLIYAGYDEAQGAPSTAIWSQRRYSWLRPGLALDSCEHDGLCMHFRTSWHKRKQNSRHQEVFVTSLLMFSAFLISIIQSSASSVMSNYFLMDIGNYNNNSARLLPIYLQ